MNWIKFLFSLLWRLWVFLSFCFSFVSLIPILFLFTSFYKSQIIINYITKYLSYITLLLAGINIKLEIEQPLNDSKQYILCSNHTSTLDIPIISTALQMPLLFIGKKELVKIPIFGYFYKHNSIMVNRESIKDSYSAYIQASEAIDKGFSVCIFPEGGIPEPKIQLRNFKNGAFKLAYEKNIEIIPITICDVKKKFPSQYYKGFPGNVRIKIHKPISSDKKSIEDLKKSAYNTIFEELKNHES